ncbi:MAG TPA: serine/threonine-protein kinase [Gemmata sp.]|jgi:serine/threonine-protein kinase|nr:serine/threonine-protein kinase [Gemmata sp.]
MTSPTLTAAPVVRDAFLTVVRAAELFTAAQLKRAEAAIPLNVATAAEAAHAMVAAGFLTKFQAERLLGGRTDGFHLGPYVIQEQVGRSAMGRVYKAMHRTMNRPVAIKVLSADLTKTLAARQAFQREVRSAAQLNHPNIVTAYDANELADRFYLIFEFVDGPNLETLVRERGPLPLAEACELVRQAALGLAHAHAHGMVHRDIQPANLLVARASQTSPRHLVKIADFGIAKLTPSQTPMRGELVGNPDYIAPEQAHNPRTADYRADLYSLGAVLYFLLSGRPMFPGGTIEEKVRQHLLNEPIGIERLRPDVQPAIATLIHQLLAKNPDARPSSAEEVADRLDGLLGASGGAISFELPAPSVSPYSFVVGQLSGWHPVPVTESVAELSGRQPGPDSGVYSVAAPSMETSPWEQITSANQEMNAPVLVLTTHSRTRSCFPTWRMSSLLAGMLVVCVAAIGLIVKVMVK